MVHSETNVMGGLSSGQPVSLRRPARPWVGWLVAFAAALALYASTASRGPQWQDFGVYMMRIITGELDNPRGLALTHPLHHWLGRLVVLPGWSNPAYAITLVSAFGAALAVANVFGCVRSLTGRASAAVFAAVSLAVAHTFWQFATITETYTLTAGLLAGECWCMVAFSRDHRRVAFLGMFLLNGLGFANHLQAVLTLPVLVTVAILWWRAGRISGRYVVLAAVVWLIGSAPYTSMIAAEWIQSGDCAGTIRSALFGREFARNVLNTHLSPGMMAFTGFFIVYNFPNLLLPAAFLGIWQARQAGVAAMPRRALLAGLLIHAGFALRYNVIDQYTFFLPMYVLLCLFAGIGAARVLAWPTVRRRRAGIAGVILLVLTPVWYAVVPAVLRKTGMMRRIERHKPYRDDYVYFLAPWQVVERSAQTMAAEAVAQASPDGVVLVESTMAMPAVKYTVLVRKTASIELHMVPSTRSDVDREAFLQRLAAWRAAGRPVVLVPDNVTRTNVPVPPGMRWQRRGDLYALGTDAASSPAPAASRGK